MKSTYFIVPLCTYDQEKYVTFSFQFIVATATATVQEDIIEILGLNNPKIIRTSIDRPNVEFIVCQKNSAAGDLLPILYETAGSIIIYVWKKTETEALSNILRECGFNSKHYHGDVGAEERDDTIKKFLNGDIQIIVATIAFGMGIDRKNVRCVIHYGGLQYLEK